MTDASRGARTPPMAWAVWGLVALFYCYGSFQRVAPAVMVPDLMAEFAAGAALLGSLSAFYFYAYATLQLPVGLMLDRWGERRVMTAAAVLAGAGSLLFAIADDVGTANLGRLLIGTGSAFTWIGCLTTAAIWFPPRRFALVAGLSSLAGMVGAIGAQAPLAALVTAIGWRDSMLWGAAFAFLLAIAIAAVVRDRPRTRQAPGRPPATVQALAAGVRAAAADRQLWIAAFAGCMMSTPVLAFAGLWGVPYLMAAYELSRPGAALIASVMMIGWAIGGPVFGWLSDRTGRRRRPMIAGAVGACVTMAACIYVPGLSTVSVGLLLFVNGFFAGSMILVFAVIRERHGSGHIGSAYGLVNTVIMSSGAVFQPLIGLLLDLGWDGRMEAGARVYSRAAYDLAFGTLPAVFAAGIAAMLLIHETWCRPVTRPAAAEA
jgi:MFS family permease